MADKSLSTREKIINTTIYLIAKEGINNTSAGNIAKQGNFNKSIIFYYFKNIDELFLKSLLKSIEKISPILKSNFNEYNNFKDYLNKNIISLILDREKIIYLKIILSFAHQNIYLENNLGELRTILIDDLLKVLMEAIDYYSKRNLDQNEIETIASLVMTTFNGLGILLLQDDSNEKFLRNWKFQVDLINNYIA